MLEPRHARYGSLDCILIDGGPSPTIPVVLCHGYGAPGHDLAGIGPEWIDQLGPAAERFRFVFPAAPHTLAELGMPDGRAWWPINMAQLATAVQANRFDDLHDKEPPGIDQARHSLCETVQQILQPLGGESTPLVLGGFSQGAMLTLDASLRGDIKPPQVLIQFSGTVVCESKWQAAMSRLAQTRIYQSHGTVDPILPFSSAERLRDLFREAELQAEFHSFVGPHTIDQDSIATTAKLLQEIAVH